MLNNVARYGALGLVGGSIAGAAAVKPKTQSGEHALNKFTTAVGLGAVAFTPYAVKKVVQADPKTAQAVALKAGKAIEKGTEYALKYGKKVSEYAQKVRVKTLNTETGAKAVGYIKKAIKAVKNSEIGQKVIGVVSKYAKKVASNTSVQKTVTKATEALKNFASSSTAKKGKIGLIAAGVALLAYAGLKTISNYWKKEGAIDQKYQDMKVMNELLS